MQLGWMHPPLLLRLRPAHPLPLQRVHAGGYRSDVIYYERDSQGAVFITDGPGISGVPTIPSLLAEYPARYTPRLAGQAYLAVALLRGGGLTGSYHDNGIPPPPSLPY